MTKTERQTGIALFLMIRGRATAAELAKTFEVAERTIYRDIDALCQAQLPILAEQGRDGGYSLMSTVNLRHVSLTPDEGAMLVMSLNLLSRQGMGLETAELRAARLKLEAALPDAVKAVREDIGANIALVEGGWKLSLHPELPAILKALVKRNTVELTYQTGHRGPVNRRQVDPHLLFHEGFRCWHMAGFCHLRQAIRVFALDHRLRDVTIRTRTFAPHPDFDPDDYLDGRWRRGMYERLRDEGAMRVRVRVRADATAWISHHPYYRHAWIEHQDDGRVILTFYEADLALASRQLLHFGSSFEVLEPEELRGLMAEEVRRLAHIYGI